MVVSMASCVIMLTVMAAIAIDGTVGFVIPKRTLSDVVLGDNDYHDYNDKYDDYPVVVSKRAALLLDRLMVALQKAVEDQDGSVGIAPDRSVRASNQPRNQVPSTSLSTDKSSINRRAQGKGRVYWQCYFNAVTCFK